MNNHQRDHFIVTKSITMQGICDIINCDLGYLSRILKKNESDGLLFSTKLNIKGENRKHKVYFLTEKGIKCSKEINEMIKSL